MYPSDQLEVLLKKDEHVLHKEEFSEDDSTNTETKTVTYTFHPTAEDIGKEITCVAKLPIADMDFEPKERTSSQKLNANCKYFCTRALARLAFKAASNTSYLVWKNCSTVLLGCTLLIFFLVFCGMYL